MRSIKLSSETHHRYLFDWRPNQDPAISNIVSKLKGGGSTELWLLFADEFFRKHPEMCAKSSGAFTFLPVPGAGEDHAFQWAKSLSQCFHGSLETGKTDKVVATKRLRRSERANSRTQWKLPDLSVLIDGTLVIADDILTTGTTAQQLVSQARAQGYTGPIEVWTLIYRTALF
jgi:predicted amidophosphoribosyltransferase